MKVNTVFGPLAEFMCCVVIQHTYKLKGGELVTNCGLWSFRDGSVFVAFQVNRLYSQLYREEVNNLYISRMYYYINQKKDGEIGGLSSMHGEVSNT